MKVSKSDTLAGLPLIKIRDLLRPYREGAIAAEDVEAVLSVSGTEAEAVLQAMVGVGFVEATNEPGSLRARSRKCRTSSVPSVTECVSDGPQR